MDQGYVGRQQVYNALLSHYLDHLPEPREQRNAGRGDALVWAAMACWGIDETAATERVAEDLEERLASRC